MFGRTYIIEKCMTTGWTRATSEITCGEFKSKSAAYAAIAQMTAEFEAFKNTRNVPVWLAPMRVRRAK